MLGESFDTGSTRTLIDEHAQMKANHTHVLSTLLNLTVWHRLFIERVSAENEPDLVNTPT